MTTKKRVQNYLSLFPELEGGAYGGSLSTTKKPRRTLNSPQVGNYKGKEETSRERRNREAWDILFPTPKKK